MMHLRKSGSQIHHVQVLTFRRTEAKGLLLKFQTRKTKTGENAYSHLLEVLLRMRQCCNHWTLCGEDRISRLMEVLGENKKLELNSENRGHLQDLLQLAIDQQEVSEIRCYGRFTSNNNPRNAPSATKSSTTPSSPPAAIPSAANASNASSKPSTNAQCAVPNSTAKTTSSNPAPKSALSRPRTSTPP